jgi:ribosome biogenesis GTPase
VRLDDGRMVEATLRGKLKQQGGAVVIGDRVAVAEAQGAWTIEAVEPRRSQLVRMGRGGRVPKVLAANLDRVFAVLALMDPPASRELIDRLLVMIEAGGMHPLLALNKVDLPGARDVARELASLYESLGYRTFVVSAVSREGLEALRAETRIGTSALVGPSGVGKSSLLNALDPGLALRTGELSAKTGRGRHTTVSSRLMALANGGYVADTPGFGDVTLWGVAPEEVARCFPEFAAPAAACRFRTCTHRHEPDCGVLAALGEGRIATSRYRSYVKIRAEAEEIARS